MSRTAAPLALRVRESEFDRSPVQYARHLARYITSASTIRVNTMRMFGRAPSLDIINKMVAECAKAREPVEIIERYGEEPSKIDSSHWRPRGLVTIEPPKPRFIEPAPFKRPRLEPKVAAPGPAIKPERIITPADVIAALAYDYRVDPADITGRDRHRKVTFPRFAAAFVLRQRGNSTSQVGRFIGGRDHSTIIHACEQFKNRATGNDWAIVRQYYREAAE